MLPSTFRIWRFCSATGLVVANLVSFWLKYIDNQVKKDFFSIKGETLTVSLFSTETTKEVLEKVQVLEQEGQEFWNISKTLGVS